MENQSNKLKVGESRSSVYYRSRKRTREDMINILTTNASQSESDVNITSTHENNNFQIVNSNCRDLLNTAYMPVRSDENCINSTGNDNDSYFSTDSDSDSDCFEDCKTDLGRPIEDKLKNWSVKNNITITALGELLHILQPYFSCLPLDANTFLGTEKNYNIVECGMGQYYHKGVSKGLQTLLAKMDSSASPSIEKLCLQLIIDGLPLFKSSNTQFWPILCHVVQPRGLSDDPFIVGVYRGPSKPPITFLNNLVTELQELLTTGLTINSQNITVEISSIICDAPARAFVKCIKSHSGYSSCEKCTQKGEWEGKVIYPETNCPLRTDEGFLAKVDEDHHLPNLSSPFVNLPVNLVSQFPLDPMHLVYLGVMRRLLLSWVKGLLTVRLPAAAIIAISSLLMQLRAHIPSDFARQPRSLSEVERWKATEFRLFLLYLGPVVLRKFLKDCLYKHFLLLFTGITILSKSSLCTILNDYAASLLILFVKGVEEMYGRAEMVYNIHGLTHIAQDVNKFGPLEHFSAFKFENKLKSIKRLVRKPQLPLQQVIRRLSEIENCQRIPDKVEKQASHSDELRRQHLRGPIPPCFKQAVQYSEMVLSKCKLNTGQRNGCVMLKNGSVVQIRNFVTTTSENFIIYNKFASSRDFFDYPMKSSKIDILQVCNLEENLHICTPNDIKHKCVLLPLEDYSSDNFAAFALVHM